MGGCSGERWREVREGAGWLYALWHNSDGAIKFGATSDPSHRLYEYRSSKYYNPQKSEKFDLLYQVPVQELAKAEKELHKQFRDRRASGREWYIINADEAKRALERFGTVTTVISDVRWRQLCA